MNKLVVAVIFGSRSTEHDVSIITAVASIIKPLELAGKYEVIPIYIDKQGKWFSDPKFKDVNLFTSGNIDNFTAKLKPLTLQLAGGLKLVKLGIKTKSIKVDVVFPATHGTHGEDGELMGLLEMANVPYVGCDMPSSVLSMDKALAKILTKSQGILTSDFEWFYTKDFVANQKGVLQQIEHLQYPLFVKPVHLGSSIAISRVKNAQELINAIEVAAHYDHKVIVEEAVNNLIEVTVPIIGNDKLTPALVEQPMLKGEDFFDFNTKYMGNGGKKGKGNKGSQGYSKLPAEIAKELYEKSEQTALAVYRTLGCLGTARIDLLIDEQTKKVYFNEVNPLPGSLYSHNWRQAGKSNVQLVSELVDLALEHYQQKQSLTTSFETNYLKQY
jgi:D-alanine-D-alanine ligase